MTRIVISIHALLAESDVATVGLNLVGQIFLSTLSLRRATFSGDHGHIKGDISIHALLAESDPPVTRRARNLSNFYPRSPCGERHNAGPLPTVCMDFYPRSPCGERPRVGAGTTTSQNFYPRSPCGERRRDGKPNVRNSLFLSTLSLRRATSPCCGWFEVIHYFYPRSPCGERL